MEYTDELLFAYFLQEYAKRARLERIAKLPEDVRDSEADQYTYAMALRDAYIEVEDTALMIMKFQP